ncbi:MAG: hypothetical protein JZU50_14590 [Desulfobulbaceae bacterium]|jgi:transposase|nr:hypothetical protein [Desulfobulbaceae bacterium]
MARPARGTEVLDKAKEALAKARTVEEIRQAQAVILPLEYDFSMEQVAAVIGVSRGWACQLRTRFIRSGGQPEKKRQRGGRRRENMSKEEEALFLAPFFAKEVHCGLLVVGEVKKALDVRLGRKTALATVYNLLHRHNWRKLVPDKDQFQVEVATPPDWKKTIRKSSHESAGIGQEQSHAR